jgi:RimJ/RimL family protein N-acetyltransferase
MLDFEIREAAEADADALHRYMEGIVSERLPVLYDRPKPPSIEEEREFVRAIREVPGSVLLVATQGQEVIGVLDFHREKRPQAAHGGQFGMSVASGYRGQGVGTALLAMLIARAPSAGISRLELQVFENNHGAIRLYERVGFQHEGRRRRAAIVGGVKIDLLLMALELPLESSP